MVCHMTPSFITISDLRRNLSPVLAHVTHVPARIPIMRHRILTAALVPYSDFVALEEATQKSSGYRLQQSSQQLHEFNLLKDALTEFGKGR